ncbi:MAG: phenylalanine--tRNA ligase subunit beta [Chloroflexi bacterium]|nr:phenylalanine--tRNA ligase subunit beta [Chloroflexota bacterium]MCL5275789.1 phenylalanine--tRNA ligase subunit beta [Chloroflexota bacterium]
MRVPLSWLKEYVDITLPVAELVDQLTMAGLEVEHVEYIGLPGAELPWDPARIFVGLLLKVERHPNADKLLLATVEYGASEPITVVTGAPNIRPGDSGQKVVLALKGARLYDGHKEGRVIMTLKEATLRGIKNDSMVCSEKELGISDEHEGILILPADAPVGKPLADYLGDVVLDIAILPSTIRAASIIGVAREVAALTGQTLRYPPVDYSVCDTRVADQVELEIRDPKLNPRFTIGIVNGVAIKPSPHWMQRRLTMAGMRPISNIVDISNYVMLETGQPTHAFDYDAISKPARIITRLAEPGEKLMTLDGEKRELLPTDIVVADSQRALSIAGVMGGADSEVTSLTANILFEVAAWNWVSIRRTARHHNLKSEASYRFARNIHPELTMFAQRRGLALLQQYADGAVSSGILDAYPQPLTAVVSELDPAAVTRLLGVEIGVDEMARILRSLEFTVRELSTPAGVKLQVTAPLHRTDIEGPHDLIEEIARIYGYNRIPATLMADEIPPAVGSPAAEFDDRLRDILAELGLQEIVSYRFTTQESEARILPPGIPQDDRRYITLQNPINPERVVMRHTLVAGALENLAANLRHRDRVAIFELGSVYLPSEDGVLPDEVSRLVIAVSGSRTISSWQLPGVASMDFYDLKGVIEALLAGLHLNGARYELVEQPIFYPGRVADVLLEGRGLGARRLGVFGELHPRVREAWNFPTDAPVLIADLDVDALRSAVKDTPVVSDVPRFPAVNEDLAVIVSEDVRAEQVHQVILRAGGQLLRVARLFDIYRGEQVGAGKKSMAYALAYQADDRTLNVSEVEKQRAKIIRALETQVGGAIRR